MNTNTIGTLIVLIGGGTISYFLWKRRAVYRLAAGIGPGTLSPTTSVNSPAVAEMIRTQPLRHMAVTGDKTIVGSK